MIYGVGIDSVTISVVERFLDNPEYAKDIFTAAEEKLADTQADRIDFFAGVYAAKSAVWKSVDHLINGKLDNIDIEVLEHEDGAPYVNITGRLKELLEGTGVKDFKVSITTEGDTASAIVIAQGK
jgi:holo-[acyl-carrier protein] synthase